MFVGLLEVELVMRSSHSLKEKRRLVKSITTSLRSKYNVSVSIVDGHELWQKAVLGVSSVNKGSFEVRKQLTNIRNFIENLDKAEITRSEIYLFSPE